MIVWFLELFFIAIINILPEARDLFLFVVIYPYVIFLRQIYKPVLPKSGSKEQKSIFILLPVFSTITTYLCRINNITVSAEKKPRK